MITLDEFFRDQVTSRQLYNALLETVNDIGLTEQRITKSQIAFRLKQPFAWVWIPGRYLRGRFAPIVLTISFPKRDPSPRWKEIVEPTPGRFMHHLEVYSVADLDQQVRNWLSAAMAEAN
jgi:hypothetical protein